MEKSIYAEDSPRFAKSVHDFHQETTKLLDYFRLLTKSMKQFCRSASACAESGRALAGAIDVSSTGLRMHQNIVPILTLFGTVFSEFAHSQEILAEQLESAFSYPIEEFSSTNVGKFISLQQAYVKDKESMEASLSRYLQPEGQGSLSNMIRDNSGGLETRALDLVCARKKFEMTRFDTVRTINVIDNEKCFELANSCIAAMVALKTHHHVCEDRLKSLTSIIEDYSKRQTKGKEKYYDDLKDMDRDRVAVDAVLSTMVERVESQMPPPPTAANIDSSDVTSGSDTQGQPSRRRTSSTSMTGEPDSSLSSVAKSLMSNMKPAFLFKPTGPSTASNNSSTSTTSTGQSGNNASAANLPVVPQGMGFEESEVKLRPLDKFGLQTYFKEVQVETRPKIIKQGYVFERQSGKLMNSYWQRRWLVLDQEKLYFIDENITNKIQSSLGGPAQSQLDAQTICDLMLCNVKERPVADIRYCFEIAYANVKTFTFQAEGQQEYESWIESIRSTVEARLTHSPAETSPSTSQQGSALDSNNDGSSLQAGIPKGFSKEAYILHQRYQESVKQSSNEILRINNTCADCHRAGPDWVSLNLGSIICIECSGIHRSLGVHISKVRSLHLDELLLQEYRLFTFLGNELNKAVWEAEYENLLQNKKPSVVEGNNESVVATRPAPSDGFAARDSFIRAKYQRKLYQSKLIDVIRENISNDGASSVDLSQLEAELSQFEAARSSTATTECLTFPHLMEYLATTCRSNKVSLLSNLVAHDVLHVCSPAFATVDLSDIDLSSSVDSKTLSHPLLVCAASGALQCVVLLVLCGQELPMFTKVTIINNSSSNDQNNESSPHPSGGYKALLQLSIRLANANGHNAVAEYLSMKIESLSLA